MTDLTPVYAELADRRAFLAGLRETTFFEVAPTSVLASDDAALAPLRLSELARHTFVAATEQLVDVTSVATRFALLRSSLESAAIAIWLLEADDPTERRTRLLSEVWGDIRDSDRLATSLGGVLESLPRQERDWKTVHAAVFGDANPVTRQLPVGLGRKIEVAATVVAEFTEVPNAAVAIRSSWTAFGAIARGRSGSFDLDANADAMTAGSLSLVLDVLETAASLYHVRAVGTA
ncbi:hypothetical protein GCM10027413_19320 [Conyzicola nivalis]|uniref:Uncharacterized protein n=1 Tax=Conyzicola nivalis TaxID=1477021 RepID=A0A916SFW1_9MICO|nr:hypothetical protein [Conyzicola nivalis]GGA95434.1 hypothetical protein GCM10010979_07300 [Conyzicola nivalis]